MQWTHYGCWRCPTEQKNSKRPLSAIVMSGWAKSNYNNTWSVNVGTLELSVLLTKCEHDFLKSACLIEHLSCWLTGLVVVTNRTKIMVPDEINVYKVGSVPINFILPSSLGKKLANSARVCNNGFAWMDALKINQSLKNCHPLAILALQNQPRISGVSPEVSIGHFFATHMQAASDSRTCQVHPCAFTRLGSSDNIYDYTQDRCVRLPPPSGSYKPLSIKGGFLIANLPNTLVNAVVGAVSDGNNEKDMIICSRASLISLTMILDQANIRYTCMTNRSEVAAGLRNDDRLAVVTTETCETYYRTFSRIPWNRIIMNIGWPSTTATKFLKCKHFQAHSNQNTGMFGCNLQLMLVLASDLPYDILNEPPDYKEVAQLLGLPEHALGDYSILRSLLPERVFKIEDQNMNQPKIIRHSTVWLEAPTQEEIDNWSLEVPKRLERLLLGQLATAGRDSVSILPAGQNLVNYFGLSAEGSSSDSYLSTSIQKNDVQQCAICMGESRATAVTSCGHWYCPTCITKAFKTGFKQCPMCREPLPKKRDVVVSSFHDIRTSFLEALSTYLKDTQVASEKTVVIMSWGSTHERVCRFMRDVGIDAVSWSGNSKQLQKNILHFIQQPNAYLFADPTALSLKWLALPMVRRFLIVYPLNNEFVDTCCQLRDCLNVSSNATFVFLRLSNLLAASIGDIPTCASGIKTCPILLETGLHENRNEVRSTSDSHNNSPNQIEIEPQV